jgi:hypothetical protein
LLQWGTLNEIRDGVRAIRHGFAKTPPLSKIPQASQKDRVFANGMGINRIVYLRTRQAIAVSCNGTIFCLRKPMFMNKTITEQCEDTIRVAGSSAPIQRSGRRPFIIQSFSIAPRIVRALFVWAGPEVLDPELKLHITEGK